MADYCDPDLMLITETKLDSSIFSSELLPKGYVGEFRRDRNLHGGGVMIVTKDCYTITDLVLQTTPKNETELVWATITKDHSKLVVGSFYRPQNQEGSPILELESKLSEITDTLTQIARLRRIPLAEHRQGCTLFTTFIQPRTIVVYWCAISWC